MKWTVIGLYDETGQTFAHEVEADDPDQAMGLVARDDLHGDADACIVGAIAGAVTLRAPCEDSGNVAYAIDVALSEGDDLCDICHRSGVQVDHTHDNGDTVCSECAEDCDHE